MVTPVVVEESSSGTLIISGKGRYIMLKNWNETDQETGFISQESIDFAIADISTKLISGKFTDSKPSEQGVIIEGSTIIITQSLRSSGKLMTKEQSVVAARLILQQFFQAAVQDGFFDNVDPNKLMKTVNNDQPSKG